MLHQHSTTTRAAARDLAISAVASDAALVSELIATIATRLQTVPSWQTTIEADATDAIVPFSPSTSRVVLVLFHHLWLHDEAMQRDVPMLRERLEEEANSVCVLSLDATPLPTWLRSAARFDLMGNGRELAASFVVDAVANAGGNISAKPGEPDAAGAHPRWPETPVPFLSQQRAQSALRHELDALGEALTEAIDHARVAQPDRTFDLQIMPQRIVARLDDVAVSFSWLASRSGTVSEGNLLVIGWRGATAGMRGMAALKTAAVIHERTYVADGDAPTRWQWRSSDLAAHPYSSANLVAEWMARASIARAG